MSGADISEADTIREKAAEEHLLFMKHPSAKGKL